MAAALEILKKASAPGSSAAAPPPSIPVPTLGTRKSIIPPPTVAPKVKQTVIKFSDAEFTEEDRKVLHSVYANHLRANENDLRPECREHILILADTLDEEKRSPAHALDRQNLFIFVKPFDSSSGAFVRIDSKDAFQMYGAKTLVSALELATIVLGERFWSGSVHLLERSLQRFIGEQVKGSIEVALEDIETYDELATHYLEHANAFSLHKQLADAEGTGKIGVCARRAIPNTTNTVTFACMAHPKMTGHLWVGRYRFVAGPNASAAIEDSTPAPVSKPEPAPAPIVAAAPAAKVVAVEPEAKKAPEPVVATPAKEDQVMKEKEKEEEAAQEEESLALDGDIEPVDRNAENDEEEEDDEDADAEKDKHTNDNEEDGEESNNNDNNDNEDEDDEDDEKSAEPEPGSGSAKRKKSITWDAGVKEPRGPGVPKSKRNQSVGGGAGNGRRKVARTAEEIEARKEERRAKDREAQRIKRAKEREARELAKAKKESLASAYLAAEVAKAERAKEKEIAAKKQESAAEEDDFEPEDAATSTKRKPKAPAAAAVASAPKRGKRAKADKSEVIDLDSGDGEQQEKKKKNAEADKPKEAEIPPPPPSIDGLEAQRRSRSSIPHNIFATPRYEVKLVRDAAGRPSRPIRFVMQDNKFPPTSRTILTPELGPAANQVRFELENSYTGLDAEEIERIMAIVQRPLVDPLARGPGYWFFSMQATQAGDIIVDDCGRAVLITDDSPARTLKGPQLVPYIDDISALYELRGIGYARQQLETAHHHNDNSAQ